MTYHTQCLLVASALLEGARQLSAAINQFFVRLLLLLLAIARRDRAKQDQAEREASEQIG